MSFVDWRNKALIQQGGVLEVSGHCFHIENKGSFSVKCWQRTGFSSHTLAAFRKQTAKPCSHHGADIVFLHTF